MNSITRHAKGAGNLERNFDNVELLPFILRFLKLSHYLFTKKNETNLNL